MHILLTGSTGFLGGKLINNLVCGTDNHLHILVRNMDKADRLKATFTQEQQNRIHLFEGDITKHNCGLDEDQIQQLKDKTQCFYHAAALVKFDLDLKDELFTINYQGTKNALNLAKNIAVKQFYYVSTAYTVGKKEHGVEELYSTEAEYNNPYEESKVHSEHLAMSYSDVMDISIFRPAIIIGDSKTGEADSEYTLYGFMRALDLFKRKVTRRKGVDERTTYRVIANQVGTSNFVPVDYVANVLALAVTNAAPNTIYNIINPHPPTNMEILSMFKEALKFEQLSLVDSNGTYQLSEEEERLNAMIDIFQVYLSGNIKFMDHNTQELIKHSSIEHLDMPYETVQMIINKYFDL